MPVLGRVVTGLIGDFLDGIRAGLAHLGVIIGPENTGSRVLTFDPHRFRHRAAQSVQGELTAAGVTTYARKSLQRVVWIAHAAGPRVRGADTKERKIVQLVDGDVMAHVATFRFQQRSLGADGYSLSRGITYFQTYVLSYYLCSGDCQIRMSISLETLYLRRNRISAYR